MVRVDITVSRRWIDDEVTMVGIRDALHASIVETFAVKPDDVEVRFYGMHKLNLNSGELAIEIIAGPGKNNSRIDDCRSMLVQINRAIEKIVPKELRKKGKSNIWLLIGAKGSSMPIGCLEFIH